MKTSNIIPETSTPVINEVSEDEKKLKYVRFEINERNRLVPVVVLAFHDLPIDDICSILEPDDEADIFEEGIGFSVQPMSNIVRVLIRPDVPKKTAQKILKIIIKIIGQDKCDWQQETDNYLNRLIKESTETKRVNQGKSATKAA